MGTYIDDERQSPRPPGPRPAGLAANAPSAASQQLKGSTDPVFAAASCIWGLCGQSILIFRRDRALVYNPISALGFGQLSLGASVTRSVMMRTNGTTSLT